ncbi:hypothetical protein [Rhizobium jaguaris]|uniref:hypothetical protein n=1 Tax=Rhizobium jaguaris TaxID=1312183 RepID=UPI0013C48DCE|nr:hypothetical protein [Rhizobium jaguaris]
MPQLRVAVSKYRRSLDKEQQGENDKTAFSKERLEVSHMPEHAEKTGRDIAV